MLVPFFRSATRPPARLSVLVALHVQSQVVRAGEAAAAGQALEGLGPGVLPVMPGQLVRSGEAPVAVVPRAAIRLLACRAERRC